MKKKLKKEIIQILKCAMRTIEYCRKQQYFYGMQQSGKALDTFEKSINAIIDFLSEIEEENLFCTSESILAMLADMLKAQEEKDYVLLSDLYEFDFIPFLIQFQQMLFEPEHIVIDEEDLKYKLFLIHEKYPELLKELFEIDITSSYNMDRLEENIYTKIEEEIANDFQKGYHIEYTATGEYTAHIPKGKGKIYLHSNNYPGKEAFSLAQEWLAQEKNEYLFYGIGLGYPYYEMLELDHSVSFKIVEYNKAILRLAVVFGEVARLLASERASVILDEKEAAYVSMAAKTSDEIGCFVHYPSLYGIQDEKVLQQMEDFFVNESSVRTQIHRLNSNFKRNLTIPSKSVWELKGEFQGKDIIIVAAGPSLDRNIELLRQADKEKTVILATGTVLKKMLELKIIPDYVIITDSGEGTYPQIDGVEECQVPLLFLSTTYFRVAENYYGMKYILFQKGFDLAEREALKRGELCIETGGSVTTTALDLGIKMECDRVVFVGLDLAYTGGYSHASGTAQYEKTVDAARKVEGSSGEILETAQNLNMYRLWMEKRIRQLRQENNSITIIDATEGGAKINGMECCKLVDVLHLEENLVSGDDAWNKKLISIIIPCYNVEEYIDRCIESLVDQTIGIEHLELILVDDKSSDQTVEHLVRWEEKYPESILVILCEKNGRQGAARNIGLQYASAEIVSYVDADDWVELEMYEKMYQKMMAEDVDVVICQAVRDFGDGQIFQMDEYQGKCNKSIYINTAEQRKEAMKYGFCPGVWGKLYKKNLLVDNDIAFPEELTYEDNYFGSLLSYYINSYLVLPEKYYHYYVNHNSTICQRNNSHHLDRLEVAEMLVEELKKRGFEAEYHDEIEIGFLRYYFLNTLNLLFTRYDEIPYDVIKDIQKKVFKYYPHFYEDDAYQKMNEVEKALLNALSMEFSLPFWENIAEAYLSLLS